MAEQQREIGSLEESERNTAPTEPETKVYGDLPSLVREQRLALRKKSVRAYKSTITVGSKKVVRYAVANGPGAAAVAMCDVELVSKADLADAALDALDDEMRPPV